MNGRANTHGNCQRDGALSAMSNALVYYPDSKPGIARFRHGRGFRYIAPDGTSIDDRSERARIKALAVPPAYEDVWICPKTNGHLQATGRDARARKQYRYHPDWRAAQESRKYDDLVAFGSALPQIRRRVRADLAGDIGDQDLAIAAVIALIDKLSLRVGNSSYAKDNATYGATTLQGRHVRLQDDHLRLSYRGKGGKKITRELRESRLMSVLGRLHDLPGAALVTWVDDDDVVHEVTSGQVNARLSEIVGREGITAKTFRTWAGSEAAFKVAADAENPTIKALSEAAADRLGNTPTIARNSYIHPDVIALTELDVKDREKLLKNLPDTRELRIAERGLLRLLS